MPPAADVGEPGERRGLSLPVEEGGVGRRPDASLAVLLRQHEQPILVWERQGAEQHPVHHAEDRGGRPDAEGQREHRNEGEAGGSPQRPERVPQVLEQRVHHSARKAIIGSTCVARRAGTKHASTATATSAIAAPAIASGLVGCTP